MVGPASPPCPLYAAAAGARRCCCPNHCITMIRSRKIDAAFSFDPSGAMLRNVNAAPPSPTRPPEEGAGQRAWARALDHPVIAVRPHVDARTQCTNPNDFPASNQQLGSHGTIDAAPPRRWPAANHQVWRAARWHDRAMKAQQHRRFQGGACGDVQRHNRRICR